MVLYFRSTISLHGVHRENFLFTLNYKIEITKTSPVFALFELYKYFYKVARKLKNGITVLTGFSVGVKIDSPHAKHNWTPFLRELFNDALYCSDFITSITNECLSKEHLWSYVGRGKTAPKRNIFICPPCTPL